ncbi:MAG: hypothetical protein AUK27_08020 [Deltaproteobacteria bacterium CG2_30_66_27]|nr:MAG: hypothetical protein AUK27_08020 [Deltaproteobacteria bacterium CG2_30_66_27]
MGKRIVVASAILFWLGAVSHAGLLDDIGGVLGGGKVPGASGTVADDAKVVSGLKEALSVGTANTVAATSKANGYFSNQAIKILVPEKVRKVTDVLGKVGYQKEVDDFVLSMNRAAEKAAPRAKAHFVEAIREMTFEDARKILGDGDTAVTDYFRGKTQKKLYDEFRPTVSASMDEVGVTRSYKNMVGKYAALPLVGGKAESVDLDHHVTTKALDGLFLVLGQEEKKIRTDPAARVTDLLKDVFGRK